MREGDEGKSKQRGLGSWSESQESPGRCRLASATWEPGRNRLWDVGTHASPCQVLWPVVLTQNVWDEEAAVKV